VELSKQQQSSDWGAMELTPEQLAYAASDVLYLHALWAKLEAVLKREGRLELAEECFAFLPTRGRLDPQGYENPDVFAIRLGRDFTFTRWESRQVRPWRGNRGHASHSAMAARQPL
jgi:ribonuclease D